MPAAVADVHPAAWSTARAVDAPSRRPARPITENGVVRMCGRTGQWLWPASLRYLAIALVNAAGREPFALPVRSGSRETSASNSPV